ncbi:MAG TPA: TAXI family TRAP transporter solute-binding subunit [Hyphomonadaceae bacterium]|jgi:TRAP transporter TAXI family solute receptor|nr:TAXI family TRAP transporter solute-binding subunit [Hyphomonadaceae bacterium]
MIARVVAALALFAFSTTAAIAQQSKLSGTIDVGKAGWASKRPVVASACPFGCPWGELGEFVHDAMTPLGYDVILCRNCNRDRGPRLVSAAAIPPPLDALDARTGTTTRFDAPVDFGITASGILAGAYRGEGGYAAGGPLNNLRLIAKIEDPSFLLIAVTTESGIASLAEIKAKKMKVRVLAGGGADTVLKYYGMTRADIIGWGGSVNGSMGAREAAEFDVLIDDSASPMMNPEGSHWTILSQRHDLKFLDLPEPLIQELAKTPGYQIVSTKWGLVKGVDRNIRTVGRSGEAIFARADTPETAAYDIAKAVDKARGDLIWLIRRYSIDPRTVTENQGVPLHPGAARYYREMGYIK